jgi:hypothetical protein
LGQSNSAVLLIDGKARVFGRPQHGKLDGPVLTFKDKSRVASWRFQDEGISVTQTIQLVPGDPIEVSEGVFRRFFDALLVRYTIRNDDVRTRSVGFRFLLDTYIGNNDIPLFTIPGRSGIVRAITDLTGKEIPDYIQALENPDLKNPGTIVQLNLRLGDRLEFPSRVSLTDFPGWNEKFEYEVPVAPVGKAVPKGQSPLRPADTRITDSAVVLYWNPRPLAPGKTRELGFTYGLGYVGGMAELTILNPGPVVQGSEFSLVALVADAHKGTEAAIVLPEGLELAAGSKAKIELVPSPKDDAGLTPPSPATWQIRAPLAGRYTIGVTANGLTTQRVITVRKSNVF